MENNLDLTPDGQLAFALSGLRQLDYSGPSPDGRHIVPGVFFSLDPESTNAVHIESRPGELLSARFDVDRPGRWLTLNLGIGAANFAGCKIIGFALKSDAPVARTFRVSVRTGVEDGMRDVFFPKLVVSYPKTALHLDVLQIEDNPDIRLQAPWREIVMFFPPETGEINLRDFRFFVI